MHINDTHKRQLVALNFRVPLQLRRRLRVLAAVQGVTMTSLILGLLEGVCKNEQFLSQRASDTDGA